MLKLVYRVHGRPYKDSVYAYDPAKSILTTEKPDDVDKPVGYIENGLFKPFGRGENKEVYLNPFTNRWE